MATPNLFRNSITIDELRLHNRFLALPPVEHVRVISPPTFRCVLPQTSTDPSGGPKPAQ
jgi:hypothetical protein